MERQTRKKKLTYIKNYFLSYSECKLFIAALHKTALAAFGLDLRNISQAFIKKSWSSVSSCNLVEHRRLQSPTQRWHCGCVIADRLLFLGQMWQRVKGQSLLVSWGIGRWKALAFSISANPSMKWFDVAAPIAWSTPPLLHPILISHINKPSMSFLTEA